MAKIFYPRDAGTVLPEEWPETAFPDHFLTVLRTASALGQILYVGWIEDEAKIYLSAIPEEITEDMMEETDG